MNSVLKVLKLKSKFQGSSFNNNLWAGSTCSCSVFLFFFANGRMLQSVSSTLPTATSHTPQCDLKLQINVFFFFFKLAGQQAVCSRMPGSAGWKQRIVPFAWSESVFFFFYLMFSLWICKLLHHIRNEKKTPSCCNSNPRVPLSRPITYQRRLKKLWERLSTTN